MEKQDVLAQRGIHWDELRFGDRFIKNKADHPLENFPTRGSKAHQLGIESSKFFKGEFVQYPTRWHKNSQTDTLELGADSLQFGCQISWSVPNDLSSQEAKSA